MQFLSDNLMITDLTIYYPNEKEKLKYVKPLKAVAKIIINDCLIIWGIKIFSFINGTTFMVCPKTMICISNLRIELEYLINTQINSELKEFKNG